MIGHEGEKERQLSFNDPPSRSYDRFSAAVPVTGMGSCDARFIRELHDRLSAAVPFTGMGMIPLCIASSPLNKGRSAV